MEELENANTLQSDENIALQRDKLLLTDEICDLQAKVREELGFDVIVQIRDRALYRDLKVRVLFEKASLFNVRGLCNPG